jgi:Holliday junction resolvasome RuvABC endonuclease subunit
MYQPVDKVVPKPKGKKRIIALDDATHDTGWAIFDGDTLIKYGVFSTNQSTEVERISAVKQWLINLITVWAPDTIVIEDIQLQKEDFNGDAVQNLTTYKVLAHLQGVLQNILFELHIPFETVYSAVWRKACEIKGRYRADKKRRAQLQVKKWYGLDVSKDEDDAICIGRYYLKKTTPRIIKWE